MATVVDPLQVALYNRLTTSNDFDTAMSGRIYFEQYKTTDASLPTTFPYAVFFYVSDIPDLTFNSTKEDVLVQISIFDNNSSAANMMSYTTKLRALMDYDPSSPPTLTITGWTLIAMTRESGEVFTPDKERVRQSVSTYRVQAQKD